MAGEELLGRLRAEAELIGDGGFTIDRDRARDKLRAYQLAAPHEYVLLIVEAAVLRGATAIEFTIDSDDVRIAFDAPFTPDELDHLYGALFTDTEGPQARSFQELALAINAAVAMGPRFIRVTSAGPEGACFLELRPDTADTFELRERGPAGTQIHVRDRLRVGHLFEMIRALTRATDEARVLRERCAMTGIPILINGRRISFGLDGTHLSFRRDFTAPGLVGVVGWRPHAVHGVFPESSIEILCNGVWIARETGTVAFSAVQTERRDGDWAPDPTICPGIEVRIDSRNLRKDLSQRGLVRDANFEAVLAVARTQGRLAINDLAEAVVVAEEAPTDAVALLSWWFFRCEETLAALQRDLPALLALPLWPTVGVETRRRTTAELMVTPRPLRWVGPCDGVALPPGIPWVIDGREDPRIAERLGALFPGDGEVVDVTAAVAEAYTHREGERRFRQRTERPQLPAGSHYITGPVVGGDGVKIGGAAIRRRGRASWRIALHTQGCLLTTLEIPLPMVGVDAVLVGDFTPTPAYDDAVRDRALLEALLSLLPAIEALVARLIEGGRLQGIAHRYLVLAGGRDFVATFVAACGFSAEATAELLAADPRGPALRQGASRWLAEGHPLVTVAIAENVGGDRRSLREMVELGRRSAIDWLPPLSPEERRALPRPPEHVLILWPQLVGLLEELLGPGLVRDFQGELARMAAEERFMARTIRALEPEKRALVSLGVATPAPSSGDGFALEGVVAVVDEPASGLRRGRARILRQRRDLTERSLNLALPGIEAVVNGDTIGSVDGEPGLEGPEGERAWEAIVALIDGALAPLVARALDQYTAAQGDDATSLRLFLLEVCRCALGPWPGAWAYAHLTAGQGAGEGQGAWGELLDQEWTYGQVAIRMALAKLHRHGSPPESAAEVIAAIPFAAGEERRGEARVVALRRALTPLLPALLQRLTLPGRGGEPVPLGSLVARCVAGERVGWVDYSHGEGPDGGETLLLLRPRERRVLTELLGTSNLEDRESWLFGQLLQQALEARPQLPSLEVARDEAVVVIASAEAMRPGEEPRIIGEIGLAQGMTSSVVVCTDRRPITTLQPDLLLPIVAVLDVDQLELAVDLTAIARAEEVAVEEHCRHQLPRLVEAASAAWGDLDAATQRQLRRLFAGALHGILERRHRLTAHEEALGRALERAPILQSIRGELRTVSEAVTWGDQAEMFFTRQPWLGELPEERVFFAESDAEAALLAAAFPGIRDFVAVWHQRNLRVRRLAAAAPLASGPPQGAYAAVEVATEGLRGWLWADGETARLVVGWRGSAVAVLRGEDAGEASVLRELGRVSGAIEGPALGLSDSLDEVTALTADGRRALLTAYDALLGRLADLFAGAIDRGEPMPRPLRFFLERGLVSLHRRLGAGDRGVEPLYRRLAGLPVLLLGGFAYSLDVAHRERSMELYHLGLWSEDDDPIFAPIFSELAAERVSQVTAEERSEEEAEEGSDAVGSGDWAETPASRERRLTELVEAELRRIFLEEPEVFAGLDPPEIRFVTTESDLWVTVGSTVLVDRSHPVSGAALALAAPPSQESIAVSLLVSAIFSAMNYQFSAISDAQEAAFHRIHAAHLAASPLGD